MIFMSSWSKLSFESNNVSSKATQGMFTFAARFKPKASILLLITQQIVKSIELDLSMIDCKLEPLPDIKTIPFI